MRSEIILKMKYFIDPSKVYKVCSSFSRSAGLEQAISSVNDMLKNDKEVTEDFIIDLYRSILIDERYPDSYHEAGMPLWIEDAIFETINKTSMQKEETLCAALEVYEAFAGEVGGISGIPYMQGHRRVAWLLMNYVLINNSLGPFYFSNRDKPEAMGGRPWFIENLKGQSVCD